MGLFKKEKAFLTIDRSGVRVRLENGKTERFLPSEIINISVSEDGPTVYLSTTKGPRVYSTTMSYTYLQQCAQHALDKGPVQKSDPEEKLVSMIDDTAEESGIIDFSQNAGTTPSTSSFLVDGQPIVMRMSSPSYPVIKDGGETGLDIPATSTKANAMVNLIVILFVFGFFFLPMILSFASIFFLGGTQNQSYDSSYTPTDPYAYSQDTVAQDTVPQNYTDSGIYLVPLNQTPWATDYVLTKGKELTLRINDHIQIAPYSSDPTFLVDIYFVGVGLDSATPEFPNGVPRAHFNFLLSTEPAYSASFVAGGDFNEVLSGDQNFSVTVTNVVDGEVIDAKMATVRYN